MKPNLESGKKLSSNGGLQIASPIVNIAGYLGLLFLIGTDDVGLHILILSVPYLLLSLAAIVSPKKRVAVAVLVFSALLSSANLVMALYIFYFTSDEWAGAGFYYYALPLEVIFALWTFISVLWSRGNRLASD
jgi:hypothetical protein